jgi:hypothetical protein
MHKHGPNAAAKLAHRIKTGETVQISSTTKLRGGWMRVFYTGTDFSPMQQG